MARCIVRVRTVPRPSAERRSVTDMTPMAEIPEIVERVREGFQDGVVRSVAERQTQLRQLRTPARRGRGRALRGAGRGPRQAADRGVHHRDRVRDHRDRPHAPAPAAWLRPRRSAAAPPAARVGGSSGSRSASVLVIAPWNYPVQLLLAPLVGALAAGNARCSSRREVAPDTSAALARLVPRVPRRARRRGRRRAVPRPPRCSTQRWDHIFYTGNGTVGRVVMAAAAKHLTPVTLELGGKSPAIVDRGADLDVAARRIAWGKFLNAGQTCVAPDYVLVDRRGRRTALARPPARHGPQVLRRRPASSADYGRIVNDRALRAARRPARRRGRRRGGRRRRARRVARATSRRPSLRGRRTRRAGDAGGDLRPDPADDRGRRRRRAPSSSSTSATSRSRCTCSPRTSAIADRVIDRTSPAACASTTRLLHLAVPGLPFGGVGESGMGAYHGRAGFETFTHAKACSTSPPSSTRASPTRPTAHSSSAS